MFTGMLWFDNDKNSTLTNKVGQAAEYYHKKYGQQPNLCLVHPRMVESEAERLSPAGSVEIQPSPDILLHHFWIGVKKD